MPLIKFDLLSKECLLQLSQTRPELIKGMEQKVISALCAKLQNQSNDKESLRSGGKEFASPLSYKSSPERALSVRSNPRRYLDKQSTLEIGVESLATSRKNVLSPIAEEMNGTNPLSPGTAGVSSPDKAG